MPTSINLCSATLPFGSKLTRTVGLASGGVTRDPVKELQPKNGGLPAPGKDRRVFAYLAQRDIWWGRIASRPSGVARFHLR